MECMNLIILRGIVGQVRTQQVGDLQCVSFSMCTNYAYRARTGDAVYETTWHRVTAFTDKDATKDAAGLQKGSKVEVRGRLRVRKYTDANGEEKTSYDVLAQKVILLDGKEPMDAEMDL